MATTILTNSEDNKLLRNRPNFPIFFTERKSYLIVESTGSIEPPTEGHIILPFNIDNEWRSTSPIQRFEKGVSCALRPILMSVQESKKLILEHLHMQAVSRYGVQMNDHPAIDMLQRMGYKARLLTGNIKPKKDTPILEFCQYGHFLLVDYLRPTRGDMKASLLEMTRNGSIDMAKRVRVIGSKHYIDWAYIPSQYVELEGTIYQCAISLQDTCAIHGVASLLDFAKNVGYEMSSKLEVKNYWIRVMDELHQEKPPLFEDYVTTDNIPYDLLVLNDKKWREICAICGIEPFTPKLTIGSSTRGIIHGVLTSKFKRDWNKILKKKGVLKKFYKFFNEVSDKSDVDISKALKCLLRGGNSCHLRQMSTSTKMFLAKVDGGRARNNIPNMIFQLAVFLDLDIGGCYGQGQRNQIYPIGIPYVIGHDRNRGNIDAPSLRKFLKEWLDQLVPGCWFIRVSTKPGYELKYGQDFLTSWIVPAKFDKILSDGEWEELNTQETIEELDEKCGLTKVYTHSVEKAVIQHDILQIIDNICTKEQRAEFLDNLYVDCAIIYPNSTRVDSFEELVEKIAEHEGSTTSKRGIKSGRIVQNVLIDDGYFWFGPNLGELITTMLIVERKKAQKKYGKKSPLDQLFKLIVNTVYGVLVSPYFDVGNVVAGNNITARARVLAWLMEKGLNINQSITDGGGLNINRVIFPVEGCRITALNTLNLFLETNPQKHRKLHFAPLGGFESDIKLEWRNVKESEDTKRFPSLILPDGRVLTNKSNDVGEASDWINNETFKHLQNQFSGMDVLHAETTDVYGNKQIGQFVFEMKALYDGGVFHGSCNYGFVRDNKAIVVKFRSYEGKAEYFDVDSLPMVPPQEKLVADIMENPKSVPRSKPFIKEQILKIKQWRAMNFVSEPGLTILEAGLLRECSVSQFPFRSRQQHKSWEDTVERLKHKTTNGSLDYGQSLEMLFLNDDSDDPEKSTLNMERMFQVLAVMAVAGVMNPLEDKNRNISRKYRRHPEVKNLEALKAISG